MTIVPMTITEAKQFVAVWHRHNRAPQGALFAIGLEHDGEIVGCAIGGRPIARHLDDGWTCEILRTCTRDVCPKGGVSKLYNACRKVAGALGYRKCVTYTLKSESGASLRGASWVQSELLNPRGGWSCAARRRRKGTVENVAKIRWEVDTGKV